jgi:hypothetical protein
VSILRQGNGIQDRRNLITQLLSAYQGTLSTIAKGRNNKPRQKCGLYDLVILETSTAPGHQIGRMCLTLALEDECNTELVNSKLSKVCKLICLKLDIHNRWR